MWMYVSARDNYTVIPRQVPPLSNLSRAKPTTNTRKQRAIIVKFNTYNARNSKSTGREQHLREKILMSKYTAWSMDKLGCTALRQRRPTFTVTLTYQWETKTSPHPQKKIIKWLNKRKTKHSFPNISLAQWSAVGMFRRAMLYMMTVPRISSCTQVLTCTHLHSVIDINRMYPLWHK